MCSGAYKQENSFPNFHLILCLLCLYQIHAERLKAKKKRENLDYIEE